MQCSSFFFFWRNTVNNRTNPQSILDLTYLLQAGAPHAQRRGPNCFSRPPVQVSAYLDALLSRRTSSPSVQVRQQCWASRCNCKPSRSCFSSLGGFSFYKQHYQNPLRKKRKNKKTKKRRKEQLVVPGLREARAVVELRLRDVCSYLSPLLAAPSRRPASQTLAGSAERAAPRPSQTLLAIFRDWRCRKTKTFPAERIPIGTCSPRTDKKVEVTLRQACNKMLYTACVLNSPMWKLCAKF